jgi:hypothetical protein
MQKREQDNYSGRFDPQWKYENLSKKALIRLLNEFGRAYIAIDGFWFTLVENRFGIDVAMELDTAIWSKYIPPWTTPRFRKALDIPGNNVETLFKTLQSLPDATRDLYEYTFDLKNPNYGIFTVYRCPGLSFFERKQRPERIMPVCHELEPASMGAYAALINPDMVVTALKLPPRKSPDEISCQWEFKLEPKE